MLHGHVWRLWCDRIFTTDTKINRGHLETYLSIGESAITANTYLGVAIPGRFCPNYAYHFKVVNGWPTDTPTKKILGEFQHLPIVSYQAQQYAPVDVDLYQKNVRVPQLQTREECTSAIHQSRTPKFSYTKQRLPTGPATPAASTSTPMGSLTASPTFIPSITKRE